MKNSTPANFDCDTKEVLTSNADSYYANLGNDDSIEHESQQNSKNINIDYSLKQEINIFQDQYSPNNSSPSILRSNSKSYLDEYNFNDSLEFIDSCNANCFSDQCDNENNEKITPQDNSFTIKDEGKTKIQVPQQSLDHTQNQQQEDKTHDKNNLINESIERNPSIPDSEFILTDKTLGFKKDHSLNENEIEMSEGAREIPESNSVKFEQTNSLKEKSKEEFSLQNKMISEDYINSTIVKMKLPPYLIEFWKFISKNSIKEVKGVTILEMINRQYEWQNKMGSFNELSDSKFYSESVRKNREEAASQLGYKHKTMDWGKRCLITYFSKYSDQFSLVDTFERSFYQLSQVLECSPSKLRGIKKNIKSGASKSLKGKKRNVIQTPENFQRYLKFIKENHKY